MLNRSSVLFKCLLIQNRKLCMTKCNFVQVLNVKNEIITVCEKALDLPKYKVRSLMYHFPGFQNISEEQITEALQYLDSINIPKKDVPKNPLLLKFSPLTLRNRYTILQESGINNIDINILSKYVTIVRRKNIADLKLAGILDEDADVGKAMIYTLNSFPNIKNKMTEINTNEAETILEVRLKIIKKFLSSELQLPDDKIEKLLKANFCFKHKSITNMCKILQLVRDKFEHSDQMIKTYNFILMSDYENLNNLFTKVKEIAGLSVEEVIKAYPALVVKNYKVIMQIKSIMEKENIPYETQRRCFQIFGLSANTVQERLNIIKTHPDLKCHWSNSRMLSLVYFFKRIMPRLTDNNKKCISLHKLIGSDEEFTRLTKSFGDKTRGVDSVNALSSFMSEAQLQIIKRHPFWTSVPISNILETQKLLSTNLKFTDEEILSNSYLLLYPVRDIMKELVSVQQILYSKKNGVSHNENLNFKHYIYKLLTSYIKKENITNTQLLSLVLYLLEKNHNFSGDGLWIKN